MWRYFIAWVLLSAVLPGPVSAQTLSDRAEVSLITCGPGTDLYATFGHSAVQVFDPATGIDRVYNYGTFDFDTEGFYIKFTRGKLNYILSVSTFDRFVMSYQYEGRWVYRQALNLNAAQKEDLFTFLEWNALPENREYKYDFFYDNCSTRIRDVLEKVLGADLAYPESSADTTATFREMIDLYLGPHPWSDFGIDLALGLPCDKEADYREKMFLPDYLMANMGKAVIADGGTLRPLVGSEGIILKQNPKLDLSDEGGVTWIFWAIFIFSLVAAILIPAPILRWFDILLFAVTGLLGLMLVFMWLGTDHSATKWNFNLLWALPTWLYATFMILKGRLNVLFFKIHAFWMFFIMVFWVLLPQEFHPATVPIILTLAARSWAWQKYVRFLSLQVT